MSLPDVLTGLAIAVGLVGILLPVLPGTLLVAVAVLVWAAVVGGGLAWTLSAVSVLVLVTGAVAKYALPGRHIRDAGIPTRTLAFGALLGLIGFFVVPVLGLPLGFLAGVYASELQRLGRDAAWPATKLALRAVGLSVLIELAAGVLAASLWFTGAILT